MKSEFLNLLCCPACRSESLKLQSTEEQETEIISGEIICLDCKMEYPIVGAIPRLLLEADRYFPKASTNNNRVEVKESDTSKSLRKTVTHYSAYQGKAYAPLSDKLDNKAILEARSGLKLEEFSQKVVLDAGCGAGRFSRLLSTLSGARVVGFDAGFSIDKARALSLGMNNIDWIQGDILNPPFRDGAFDRVICIGVLNLTADPERGFEKLSNLVKDAGTFSLFLHFTDYLPWNKQKSIKYALGRLFDAIWTEPMRRLITRLPDGFRFRVCRAIWNTRKCIEFLKKGGVIGKGIASVLSRIAPQSSYKSLESAHSNIVRNFDGFSTPYQFSHQIGEILHWCDRLNAVRKVVFTPFRLSFTVYFDRGIDPTEPIEVSYSSEQSIGAIESRGVEEEE